ncbi:glycosyltransferase family 2 protein [Limnobacter sp.]|uniref:glycosyltransferase family 2 protein n=1 Tax=Limnobacter sp. TaxID=2003368 RepID=UPI0027352ED1|nr:glycosyltransferase family 2 protein [Limnobacter sp.]MDP3187314.1 glycosyltransferase family 2 protein [Limnobacter sp.]
MTLILNMLISLPALLLTLLALWFGMQVVAACLPGRTPTRDNATACGRLAVLIPAHNESTNMIPTLRAVHSQGLAGLRVLVVADNCSDDTAQVAKNEGAEVIERSDPTRRGKGYALDFGIQHLKAAPPDTVIVMDADCLPAPGAMARMVELATQTQRPVQALYLMNNPNQPTVKSRIAEFAWLVKNHVRARGLHWFGLPCQLTGSGMAFPWHVLQGVPLATGEIVEDMKLGITLAARGYAPVFCEQAMVSSTFPANDEGVRSQRKRWEHGHLAIIWNEGLPNLGRALLNRDQNLLFMALDLCIPPLALLVMMNMVWLIVASIYWAWLGSAWALTISLIGMLITAASVTLAWYKFGRSVVTGTDMLRVPIYMLSKLSVYAGFLFRRQTTWVRSKRDNEPK